MDPLAGRQVPGEVEEQLLINPGTSTDGQNLSSTDVPLHYSWQRLVETILLAAIGVSTFKKLVNCLTVRSPHPHLPADAPSVVFRNHCDMQRKQTRDNAWIIEEAAMV